MRPVPVLVNPASGSAGRRPDERLASILEREGVDARVELCPPEALSSAVEEALRAGAPTVGVAGGDGSLHTAVQVLAGGSAALAPFPLGRRNHFAGRMGLDDLEAAAAALAAGHVREVALGTIDEHVFLNTAVVGAYNGIVRLRERVRPLAGTWVGTALAWAVVWTRWPVRTVTVRTTGGEVTRRVPVVWAGAGPATFPALHERPAASPGDPLEIVLPPPGGRRAALRVLRPLLRHALGGEARVEEALEVLRASRVEIDGPERLPVTLDGEPMTLRAPARLALGERTLRVVSPPPRAS